MGSGPVGDDDLWHHHIGRFSPFFFSFLFPSPPWGLPAGSEVLPAGSEVLPAGSEVLPAGSKAHPAGSEALPAEKISLGGDAIGHHPLRGRCPLTTKLTELLTSKKQIRGHREPLTM